MLFKSTRKLTLAHLGHVIVFAKGDTKFVPPALHQEAVEQGLDAVDGDVTSSKQVVNDQLRVNALKDAMAEILKTNKRDHFDAGGVPRMVVVQEMANATLKDNDERLALWAEVSRGEHDEPVVKPPETVTDAQASGTDDKPADKKPAAKAK